MSGKSRVGVVALTDQEISISELWDPNNFGNFAVFPKDLKESLKDPFVAAATALSARIGGHPEPKKIISWLVSSDLVEPPYAEGRKKHLITDGQYLVGSAMHPNYLLYFRTLSDLVIAFPLVKKFVDTYQGRMTGPGYILTDKARIILRIRVFSWFMALWAWAIVVLAAAGLGYLASTPLKATLCSVIGQRPMLYGMSLSLGLETLRLLVPAVAFAMLTSYTFRVLYLREILHLVSIGWIPQNSELLLPLTEVLGYSASIAFLFSLTFGVTIVFRGYLFARSTCR